MGNKGKKRFYAVARGHSTGIFRSWPQCEAQVKGYSGASFKGFATEQEAQNFLRANGGSVDDADRATNKRTTGVSITQRKRPRCTDAPPVIIAIQFDGGSRGNPGRAGSGAVVRITQQIPSSSGNNTATIPQWQTKTWHARSFVPLPATNNEAEYNGVIVGLTIAAEELRKLQLNTERPILVELHVQGDSNLVIQQMQKQWKVNKESLKPYFEEAMRLLEEEIQPEECTMLHVYRSDNQLADQLANEAMNTENSWYTTSDDGHEEPTVLSYWMNVDKSRPRYHKTKLNFET
ncbi:hypothetical protein FisN_24Lh049 [Fistulifera solaris]|uniref:ribonuclease H n=1 Tax=Fistulifera solaris TaxID=1519565 RepID=A0A1Z5KTU5_FISSO|nr:hypothetical protein FisN_24Lh049 [Fistulifera solaris]|eukprot:GAX29592.1 hypothetical protein FisN_24Lh049 [Fistulifera solaris]